MIGPDGAGFRGWAGAVEGGFCDFDGPFPGGTSTISESASAIVVHARGACGGFTERVGSANMHHDGAAKRRWSWAWVNAMRSQLRRMTSLDARSTLVEQVLEDAFHG